MGGSVPVRVSDNFARNLEAVWDFLERAGEPEVFGRLLDELFDTAIPNLASFPGAGVDFSRRRTLSGEGAARAERLKKRVRRGETLREYIFDDFLVLYLSRPDEVILLSIKHHRQLSFDLRGHWGRT